MRADVDAQSSVTDAARMEQDAAAVAAAAAAQRSAGSKSSGVPLVVVILLIVVAVVLGRLSVDCPKAVWAATRVAAATRLKAADFRNK